MTEIWKEIIGFNGRYWISNMGRVKSVMKSRTKILAHRVSHEGYHNVCFCYNNKNSGKLVSRLVAEYFLPSWDPSLEVNHIDCDKNNNFVNNLEMVTRQQNTNHALENGLYPLGSQRPRSKLKESDIIEIFNLRKKGLTQIAIAKKYNVSESVICRVLKNEAWKHVRREQVDALNEAIDEARKG